MEINIDQVYKMLLSDNMEDVEVGRVLVNEYRLPIDYNKICSKWVKPYPFSDIPGLELKIDNEISHRRLELKIDNEISHRKDWYDKY